MAPLLLLALLPFADFNLAEHERPRVLALAEAAQAGSPATITSVTNPRSAGGPHDFSSDADYFWPDPANPGGPYVARDGMSNPENFNAHRLLMIDMAGKVGALAAAYKITRDDRYAATAVRHLRAWFVDPATRMHPSLLYAQAVRGVSTGRRIGLIDTLPLVEPALAVVALRGSPCLTPELDAAITGWFREYLHWLRTHPFGIEESNSLTNHSTCWSLQVTCFALVTGDGSVLAECRRRLKEFHLSVQMAPDGSFSDEVRRTKPYGYSIFHLDVMTALATLLSTPDEDLVQFHLPDGRGLVRGIEWLAPFITDKEAWLKSVRRPPKGRATAGPDDPLVKPDVMQWENWPVRQPFLLFGARSTGRRDWLTTWQRLDPDPQVGEIIRNFPIRQPLLWLDLPPPQPEAHRPR